MSIVWVICLVGWILSFGAWEFLITRDKNSNTPLVMMWVFTSLLWLTK